MSKFPCGVLRPLNWIALIAAVFIANMSSAEGQTLFAVERSGDTRARTVLFIPGLGTGGDVWRDTVDTLGSDVDAHIITAVGFGGLAAAGTGPFIAPLVDDLARYIDANRLSDVTLVGHSLGAQVALQLADVRPGVVHTILAVDSPAFLARLFNPAITPDEAAAYGKGLTAQIAAMPRAQFLAMIRQGLPVQSITPEGQARVMAWMEASDQTAVARAMGEVTASDYRPVLKRISAEVTILIGFASPHPMTRDRLLDLYEDQYKALAHYDVQVVDGSRHFIMLDQSEAFMAALVGVLAQRQASTLIQ